MTVLVGDVRTTFTMRGAGDGAAKVNEGAKALGALDAQGKRATSTFGGLRIAVDDTVTAGKGFAGMVGTVSSVAGAFAQAIPVVAALTAGVIAFFDAIGNENEQRLEQFGRDVATSAEASRRFSTRLYEQASSAREAFKAVSELRAGTLQLAAANAAAAGDDDKAKKLIAQAGAVTARATAEATEQTIADASRRYDEMGAAFLAAQADERRQRDNLIRAQFEQNQALAAGDEKALAITAKAIIDAQSAVALAYSAQIEARRELGALDEKLAALRARQAEERKASAEADLRASPGFIEFDALEFTRAPSRITRDTVPTDGGGPSGGRRSRGPLGALGGGFSSALKDARLLGDGIRDFTAAMAEALPGMADFSNALQRIGDIWQTWGKTGKDTRNAIVGSLGAIAVAGAQQIKDERARAGVLALIYTALGVAHVVTPGMEAQGAGEIAAGVMLGAVALGAGGSGRGRSGAGGGSGASGSPSELRSVNDSATPAPIVVNIFAPWLGETQQDAAQGMLSWLGSINGSGFEHAG